MQGFGKITPNIFLGRIRPIAKEHHKREQQRRIRKKVYQALLIDPIDLSENSLYSIASDGRFRTTRCEPDLDRNVNPCLATIECSVYQPYRSCRNGSYVVSLAIEQRADQALLLEPEGARQPLKRCSLAYRRTVHDVILLRGAYLPAL